MAQSASQQGDARSMAMGNISACLGGVWALQTNIGGLAEVMRPVASASYHAIPVFAHFNRMAIAVAVPLAGGVGGVSAFRFGDDLYNEHVASLGYANTFGLASLGIKGNYIQYRAEGLRTRTAFTVSFGGIAHLTPHLLFGAYAVNINQPTINAARGEKVMTKLVAGMAVQPSEQLLASIEIEKDVQLPPTIKSGFEYKAFERFSFRTGFNFGPESGFAGIGIKVRLLQADYAIQLDHVFGLSHQATVTCHLVQD